MYRNFRDKSDESYTKLKEDHSLFAKPGKRNGIAQSNICSNDKSMKKPNWEKPFPTQGKGTVIFNIVRKAPFSIVVTQKNTGDSITLHIDKDEAIFKMKKKGSHESTLEKKKSDEEINVGFEAEHKISYWFSYDRDNLVVKYGKGYRMEETTLMGHDFLAGLTPDQQKKKREELEPFFNPIFPRHIQQFDMLPKEKMHQYYGDNTSLIDIEGMVQFDAEPFVKNLPYLVLDSSKIDLLKLNDGEFVFSASLPKACQELYRNIKMTDLDWMEGEDHCKLSDAIRYSIVTPDCILYNKLQEKATEFGKNNPYETYLRVTLGVGRGNSPGVPYVLEIWPKDHYSPIHDHGNSCAVIKVLFGEITIHLYNKQAITHKPSVGNLKELKKFVATKDDVTWISPDWYQTHMLRNESQDYCATVQCYTYPQQDNTQWPYFDYVGDQKVIEEFLPNSDFTFREMREKVLEEYSVSFER